MSRFTNIDTPVYTNDYITLFELTEYYDNKCEMNCCYKQKNDIVKFCNICDSTKPLHLLDNCIDLYIFRKMNKPLRLNEDDIFSILRKHCKKLIIMNNKAGFIFSSTQKKILDEEYRKLLLKNEINPDKPFLYRRVTMYKYMNLGNKNESRDSSFIASEMVFDFIHPEIVKALIKDKII